MTAPKKCAKHKIKSKYEDIKGQKKINKRYNMYTFTV